MQILIVHQSPKSRSQVRSAFEDSKVEILETNNCEDALLYLDANARCDVVLCEQDATAMTGLQLASKLQDKDIEFVLLVTENDSSQLAQAEDLVALSAIVEEPIEAEKLRKIISEIARKRQSAKLTK